MSGHTPGPWVFSQYAGWYIRADGVSLMGNHTYYPWNPENIADWQLIAAAPDLLEALTVLSDWVESLISDNECRPLENARAAIAKATGEAT